MYVPIADIIGLVASVLVFLTFCMRTLLPLRLVAISSNLFFIAYSIVAGLMPILALHVLLLPMNLWRTFQQLQTRKRLRAALVEKPDMNAILPYMTSSDYADGAIIFRSGEPADKFFVVTEGQVVVEEFGRVLPKGSIFGEIAFFVADGKRTATVRAVGPVKSTWIDRETIMRVCLDNPEFALFLTRLMVNRLVKTEDGQI